MNTKSLVKTKSIQKKRDYTLEFITGSYIHYGPDTYIAKGSTRGEQQQRKKQWLDNESDDKDLSEESDEDDKEMYGFLKDLDCAVERGGTGINSGTQKGLCTNLYELIYD